MNAVEYIAFLLEGPIPTINYYGQFLWLVNTFILLTTKNDYPFFLIALGYSVAHFLLNIYEVYTARPLTESAQFGELKPEIAEQIDAMATFHGVTIAKKQLVTNLEGINAFCARSKTNAEIYISHHWFESEEGPKHLLQSLRHELGHAFYNDPLKRPLFNSVIYTIATFTLFGLRPLIVPNCINPMFTCGMAVIIGLHLTALIAARYLQAAYNRYTEFRADAFSAAYSSPEEMQQTLLFLENLHPVDKIYAHLPEWKQGTHPKTVNRIARLEAMKDQK